MKNIKNKNKLKGKNNNNERKLKGAKNKNNAVEFNEYLESLTNNIEEKIYEILKSKKIKVRDTNKEFNNFLNKNNIYSFEDDILCEYPNFPEFYCKENQLGKNKNNNDDYTFRKKNKIETININLDLSYDEPLEELDVEDMNNENIQLELNIDENELPNPPIINDQEIRDRLEYIINHCGDKLDTITNFWKKNRKKIKLFIGFAGNKDDILRIYGKGLDRTGKIKSIEFNRYWNRHDGDGINMNSEKSIKELYDVDSMKEEELLERIDDIINKFNK